MEIDSKNWKCEKQRWHQIKPVFTRVLFIRTKKATDNKGIALLHVNVLPSLVSNKTYMYCQANLAQKNSTFFTVFVLMATIVCIF